MTDGVVEVVELLGYWAAMAQWRFLGGSYAVITRLRLVRSIGPQQIHNSLIDSLRLQKSGGG